MSDRGDNFRLEGRRVLVTGGARGIGYAIATAAARSGAAVALLDLEEQSVDAAAATLTGEVGSEIVDRVLGSGDRPHAEVQQQFLCRPARQLTIRLLPDLAGRSGPEDEINAEDPPQL